jgi:hypothetical protein
VPTVAESAPFARSVKGTVTLWPSRRNLLAALIWKVIASPERFSTVTVARPAGLGVVVGGRVVVVGVVVVGVGLGARVGPAEAGRVVAAGRGSVVVVACVPTAVGVTVADGATVTLGVAVVDGVGVADALGETTAAGDALVDVRGSGSELGAAVGWASTSVSSSVVPPRLRATAEPRTRTRTLTNATTAHGRARTHSERLKGSSWLITLGLRFVRLVAHTR